ncbi:hypothetical protein ACIGB6_10205 [Paeniglutamicibacter gangotriensis]|uniref:hypothetical protein n=1 Tax=Paeniglutamicibacter gangotriensis TaxID=254787 RepID=UPI0037CA4BD7
MSLPTIHVFMNCGSCGDGVEHDGDAYRCFDCGLIWATSDPFDESPAEYADEELAPCNHSSGDKPHVSVRPFRTVNGKAESWRTWTTVDAACHLPTGHKGDHDHPYSTTFTEHTEDPR